MLWVPIGSVLILFSVSTMLLMRSRNEIGGIIYPLILSAYSVTALVCAFSLLRNKSFGYVGLSVVRIVLLAYAIIIFLFVGRDTGPIGIAFGLLLLLFSLLSSLSFLGIKNNNSV